MLALASYSLPASASCAQSGSTINCSGTTTNYSGGSQSGITLTVQSGATLLGTGGSDALSFTNPSFVVPNTYINNGTINGTTAILSAGGGTDSFINNGLLTITAVGSGSTYSMFGSNFTQTANGILGIRVDSLGGSDTLLSFTAALNGKLLAIVQPGIYSGVTCYCGVVTTATGVTGTFASVVSSSPFFTAVATYNATSVDLTLTPIAFNAVRGLTPNQQAIANTLQAKSTGTLSANATTFYSNLFAATSVSVFDQISGEGTAATQGAAFGLGGLFINALGQAPGFGPTGGGPGPLGYASAEKPMHPAFKALKPEAEMARRWQVWGSGFGATRRTGGSSDTGTADVKQRGGGGVLGLSYAVDADRIVGVAVGASGSHFDVPDRSTNGDLTAGHVGLYGLQRFGAFYANGALAYARIHNETTRTIVGVGPAETAKGGFDSDLFSGRLEVGYAYALAGYTLTPFASIAFAQLWQRGYRETSTAFDGTPGILGLTYQAQRISSLPVSLGAQVDTAWALADGRVIRPYARAAWVHEFKPDTRIDASFITIPGTSFTIAGARAARDALKLDAGVRLPISASTAFVASGTGEFSGRSYVLAGTGKLTFSW